MTRTFYTPAQPEGITQGLAGDFYVGGMRDGSVYRGDLATGEVELWQKPGVDGRESILGLTVHGTRLIACGGQTATVFVFDVASGELIERHSAEAGSLFNDVWVVGSAAYVTDSHKPLIWRLDDDGLQVFAELPAGDHYLNGITATADGTALLVVAQGTGELWRVDIATAAVTKVAMPQGYEFGGDGLLLLGERTLLGVCNVGQTIEEAVFFLAGLTLNDDASSAVPIGQCDLPVDCPTTIALGADGSLLVVGAQFRHPVPPFEIVAMELPQIFANQSL